MEMQKENLKGTA